MDQNSILISAVVFREEKLDLDVTLMISAVLSCNHLTCLAQVQKNKVSVRLAPASRIKLTEVERLIMHLAF